MTKRNFDKPMLDLKGKPIKEKPDQEDSADLIMRDLVVNALIAGMSDEQMSVAEKNRRFKLALRLNNAGDHEIDTAEAGLIQNAVNKMYPSPLIVGRVTEVLEA